MHGAVCGITVAHLLTHGRINEGGRQFEFKPMGFNPRVYGIIIISMCINKPNYFF